MSVKNLHQSVFLRAPPKRVYDTLVDPRQHAKFSGLPAQLEPRPGGKFSHYGGHLVGYVLELKPGKRIVLAWRTTSWPPGSYSVARFDLARAKGGTRLTFEQYGIPTSAFASIASGWKEHYWEPLRALFEG